MRRHVRRKYVLSEWCNDDEKMLRAVKHRSVNSVQLLINVKQVNPTKLSASRGITALHFSVKRGFVEIVDIFLTAAIDINIRDVCGRTALHYAVRYAHHDITDKLLQNGADVNAVDNDGWSQVHHACLGGNINCVQMLITHGAQLTHRDKFGRTALICSVANGQASMCRLLLENGADINEADSNNQTPLFRAAANGNASLCDYLIRNGADVYHVDNQGLDALWLATAINSKDACKVIRRKIRSDTTAARLKPDFSSDNKTKKDFEPTRELQLNLNDLEATSDHNTSPQSVTNEPEINVAVSAINSTDIIEPPEEFRFADRTNHVVLVTDITSQQLIGYSSSDICERRLEELNDEKLILQTKIDELLAAVAVLAALRSNITSNCSRLRSYLRWIFFELLHFYGFFEKLRVDLTTSSPYDTAISHHSWTLFARRVQLIIWFLESLVKLAGLRTLLDDSVNLQSDCTVDSNGIGQLLIHEPHCQQQDTSDAKGESETFGVCDRSTEDQHETSCAMCMSNMRENTSVETFLTVCEDEKLAEMVISTSEDEGSSAHMIDIVTEKNGQESSAGFEENGLENSITSEGEHKSMLTFGSDSAGMPLLIDKYSASEETEQIENDFQPGEHHSHYSGTHENQLKRDEREIWTTVWLQESSLQSTRTKPWEIKDSSLTNNANISKNCVINQIENLQDSTDYDDAAFTLTESPTTQHIDCELSINSYAKPITVKLKSKLVEKIEQVEMLSKSLELANRQLNDQVQHFQFSILDTESQYQAQIAGLEKQFNDLEEFVTGIPTFDHYEFCSGASDVKSIVSDDEDTGIDLSISDSAAAFRSESSTTSSLPREPRVEMSEVEMKDTLTVTVEEDFDDTTDEFVFHQISPNRAQFLPQRQTGIETPTVFRETTDVASYEQVTPKSTSMPGLIETQKMYVQGLLAEMSTLEHAVSQRVRQASKTHDQSSYASEASEPLNKSSENTGAADSLGEEMIETSDILKDEAGVQSQSSRKKQGAQASEHLEMHEISQDVLQDEGYLTLKWSNTRNNQTLPVSGIKLRQQTETSAGWQIENGNLLTPPLEFPMPYVQQRDGEIIENQCGMPSTSTPDIITFNSSVYSSVSYDHRRKEMDKARLLVEHIAKLSSFLRRGDFGGVLTSMKEGLFDTTEDLLYIVSQFQRIVSEKVALEERIRLLDDEVNSLIDELWRRDRRAMESMLPVITEEEISDETEQLKKAIEAKDEELVLLQTALKGHSSLIDSLQTKVVSLEAAARLKNELAEKLTIAEYELEETKRELERHTVTEKRVLMETGEELPETTRISVNPVSLTKEFVSAKVTEYNAFGEQVSEEKDDSVFAQNMKGNSNRFEVDDVSTAGDYETLFFVPFINDVKTTQIAEPAIEQGQKAIAAHLATVGGEQISISQDGEILIDFENQAAVVLTSSALIDNWDRHAQKDVKPTVVGQVEGATVQLDDSVTKETNQQVLDRDLERVSFDGNHILELQLEQLDQISYEDAGLTDHCSKESFPSNTCLIVSTKDAAAESNVPETNEVEKKSFEMSLQNKSSDNDRNDEQPELYNRLTERANTLELDNERLTKEIETLRVILEMKKLKKGSALEKPNVDLIQPQPPLTESTQSITPFNYSQGIQTVSYPTAGSIAMDDEVQASSCQIAATSLVTSHSAMNRIDAEPNSLDRQHCALAVDKTRETCNRQTQTIFEYSQPQISSFADKFAQYQGATTFQTSKHTSQFLTSGTYGSVGAAWTHRGPCTSDWGSFSSSRSSFADLAQQLHVENAKLESFVNMMADYVNNQRCVSTSEDNWMTVMTSQNSSAKQCLPLEHDISSIKESTTVLQVIGHSVSQDATSAMSGGLPSIQYADPWMHVGDYSDLTFSAGQSKTEPGGESPRLTTVQSTDDVSTLTADLSS